MSQLINETRALVDRKFRVFRGKMVFSPADIWTIWRRRWIVWRRGTFSSVSNLAAKHVQLEDTFADMVDRWRIAQIILSVASSPGLKLRTLTAQASSRTQIVNLSLDVSLHQRLQRELGGKDPRLHPTRTGE